MFRYIGFFVCFLKNGMSQSLRAVGYHDVVRVGVLAARRNIVIILNFVVININCVLIVVNLKSVILRNKLFGTFGIK